MGKAISSVIEKWSGRASNAYTLWPLVPAGVVGGLMAYFSTGIAWIDQFGMFGWAATGLISFFTFSAAVFLLGSARERWVYAKIARDKALPPDAVNPVEREFTKRRIKFSDFVRPSTAYVENKLFTDCEILGPLILALDHAVTFSGVGFINCNWVVVRSDRPIHGAVSLRNVEFRGGNLSDMTILISENELDVLRRLPTPSITRTGDEEIDGRELLKGRVYQNGK